MTEEFLPSKGDPVFSVGVGKSLTPLSLELDVPKTTNQGEKIILQSK